MTSIWAESLSLSLDQALILLADAVGDCSDELWETSMWPVAPPGPAQQFLGPDWIPITDAAQRDALAQRWIERRSTPWSVGWHALEILDYDLNGEFEPWAPPPPFTGHPHWRDLVSLPASWSRPEVLGYIEYCRQTVRDALEGMTDVKAARPLPAPHRYGGQPHAGIITSLVGHTTEHAAQIRQFITPPADGRGSSR
jgi:hypothetical protein